MKKLLLIVFSFVFFLSCAKPAKTTSYTGTIMMCGNEPFVYPVLITEDGRSFGFDTDNETKQNLIKIHSKITVSGAMLKNENNLKRMESGIDGTIILESWSVVE